ncbi:MAG: aminotransferase class V-fold PLP-dependent enzyme [Clostridia bacterium]|nr:aminotransferase class V-fold PLP-dependent enzyme [Clostridia bacterium]
MNLTIFKPTFRDLVVGVNTKVPLKNGKKVTAINFDNAASTPPFAAVLDEIRNFSPWYSSIHRGTGYKSQICSDFYDHSRQIVADFLQADLNESSVIYVKNATEGINKLSYRLLEDLKGGIVLSTFMEHHSNDLPWRNKYQVDYVRVDEQGRLLLDDLEQKLRKYKGKVKLVTVTGASNVTGNTNPVHKIAALAHKYGAQILVDGAQLIPHAPFAMKPSSKMEHIDFLVFSAHKMYAPFGIGVLIGPKKVFSQGVPEFVGGGTIKMVSHDYINWADAPERDEAGTPNVLGVLALTTAIQTLQELNMERIYRYEESLVRYALGELRKIPDIKIYGNDLNTQNRVSIISFNLKGIDHRTLANILSLEAGISVRNGCFCAQPYVQQLLKVSPKEIKKHVENPSLPHPGMVRLSFGLYNTYSEIDTLIQILNKVTNNKTYYLNKYLENSIATP